MFLAACKQKVTQTSKKITQNDKSWHQISDWRMVHFEVTWVRRPLSNDLAFSSLHNIIQRQKWSYIKLHNRYTIIFDAK